jgi:hypothetical protein
LEKVFGPEDFIHDDEDERHTMVLARLESEAAAAAARQAEKVEQCATIQVVVAFKAKEREDVVRRVKREIIILDELDASFDSTCETYLPCSHIY